METSIPPLGGLSERGLNLGEQAYQRIRSAILFYELAPGMRVSESALTRSFGLRQAAVRSALMRLAQEGLVDKTDERSPRVAPLTLRDVREIYAMRQLLEPVAAELTASAGLAADELAQLRQISQSRYELTSHEELVAFLCANRDFNRRIAARSGNGRLAAAITQLQDLTLRVLYVGLRSLNVSEWFQTTHLQIVDAIEVRRGGEAARLWRTDLQYGERLISDALVTLPQVSAVNLGGLPGVRS